MRSERGGHLRHDRECVGVDVFGVVRGQRDIRVAGRFVQRRSEARAPVGSRLLPAGRTDRFPGVPAGRGNHLSSSLFILTSAEKTAWEEVFEVPTGIVSRASATTSAPARGCRWNSTLKSSALLPPKSLHKSRRRRRNNRQLEHSPAVSARWQFRPSRCCGRFTNHTGR